MRNNPYKYGFRETSTFDASHPAHDLVGQREDGGDWIGAPIYSMEDGVVVRTWDWTGTTKGNDLGGNWVIIANENRFWYYGHLKSREVTLGESIAEGEIIGFQGATGFVTGEHLHFQLRTGDSWETGRSTNIWDFLRDYEDKPATGYIEYPVMSGDSLWSIAKQFLGNGRRWGEIKGYTGDPARLPIGQLLYIPTSGISGKRKYVVVPGDTLWGIAQYELGDGRRWIEIKGYTGDPSQLPIGTVLYLPK